MQTYTRITDIIAPFTGIEFVPEFVLEPVCTRGTSVHLMIEGILQGFEVDVPEALQGYIDAWKAWYSNGQSPLEYSDKIIEKRLYCDKLGITGQVDLIVNEYHAYDWKTSSKESISWKLQGAAYQYLIEKEYGDRALMTFVHLKPDGTYSEYRYHNQKENFEVFKKCLELYRYFDMDKTRKSKVKPITKEQEND